jgi:hypothetical protein
MTRKVSQRGRIVRRGEDGAVGAHLGDQRRHWDVETVAHVARTGAGKTLNALREHRCGVDRGGGSGVGENRKNQGARTHQSKKLGKPSDPIQLVLDGPGALCHTSKVALSHHTSPYGFSTTSQFALWDYSPLIAGKSDPVARSSHRQK